MVIANLMAIGFPGPIYPVNPKYETVMGLRCFPSLADVPAAPDATFVAIGSDHGPEIVREAIAIGTRALLVNAGGYADGDREGVARQEQIARWAAEADVLLAGPNNLGLVNLLDQVAVWAGRLPSARPGHTAVLSQSGSSAFVLSEAPGLDLAYVITAGNEAGLNVADYLEHLAQDPRVQQVLLFLETIRDRSAFVNAAKEARSRGQNLLAVKVGRSQAGAAAVSAHTGADAGADADYAHFLRACGVVRLRDLEELVEAAVLYDAYPSGPARPSIVPITGSGGEAALLADLFADAGLVLAPLSTETLGRVAAALPSYSRAARNPLDAYGLGWELGRFQTIVDALLDDPSVGVIAPWLDAPAMGEGDAEFALEAADLLCERAEGTDKRFIVVSNAARLGVNSRLRTRLAAGGIPLLVGMRTAAAVIGRWAAVGG
jgi:acetate---CoA ligase (ADP-forming)